MKLKNFLLLSLFAFVTFACSDNNVNPTESKVTVIQSSEWQVDRFTTTDGTVVDPTLFGGNSKLIGELTYVFDKTFMVRSYDKVSKQAQAYGSWELIENDTKLKINIQGLDGTFNVVSLTKQKMILRNNIVYAGVTVPINMEFIPFK
ncbi:MULTISPECIES: hypothetical protein [unclassified Arcicella]|uniref:hypothetical protein n=1 Tax=unclassified Arcicella TaxID=2644986 RepID=UPI00285491A9|nr:MULTISPECIES: hypothetical protein [unclassified Arcicella]MDR6561616.1 hypothetical protein [Arcicella sp. BE51]MDR6812396.1 hypothetical protein [Arcicella sp. BE140]MDR6823832.1 hypothetical protein [Arcicella sp. BE139]